MGRVAPLNDTKIKSLKPKDKEYKKADGNGLYLYVSPSGSKIWKVRYTKNGKGNTRSIGKYPSVSLAKAREERDNIKNSILFGNEYEEKKNITFKELCEKYFEHRHDLSKSTKQDYRGYLTNHYYPVMEEVDANEISPSYIINVIKFLDKQEKYETIRKSSAFLDRIFRFGVTLQYISENPMASIDTSIITTPHKKTNYPHTTDENMLKEILIAIDEYTGDIHTKVALQIAPYVFLRPSNIVCAEKKEFDFRKKVWTISADKMKMDRDHVVPLSDSVIEMLKVIWDNGSEWVFKSPLNRFKHLSENTLNVGLKRLGFKDIQTAHGFRHTASTLLNENIQNHGIPSHVIEMQLAHVDKNVIRGTYNKALYLDERVKLMEYWSNYLDDLKNTRHSS